MDPFGREPDTSDAAYDDIRSNYCSSDVLISADIRIHKG